MSESTIGKRKLPSLKCPTCGQEIGDEALMKWESELRSSYISGATSEKKKKASAENGKKGGRPRKATESKEK